MHFWTDRTKTNTDARHWRRIGLAVAVAVLTLSPWLARGGENASAAPTAQITLSPTSGPVGTVITVNGRWFPKRETATVAWGGTSVATVSVAPSGMLAVQFRAPAGEAGTYVVSTSAGGVSATAPFQLTAAGATPTPTPTTTPSPIPTPTPTPTPACLGAPRYAEIRPANTQYNSTPGRRPDPQYREWTSGFGPYYDQIDGAGCIGGTTEQILEWAARKWRLAELHPQGLDLIKAMAVQESDWWARIRGDYETCTQSWCYPSPGYYGLDYQTYGITGVKRTSWADSWRSTGTSTHTSTALAADWTAATIKAYYDGAIPWNIGTKSNLHRAVGAWYCGCDNGGGDAYADRVFTTLRNRDWAQPYFTEVQCRNCLP